MGFDALALAVEPDGADVGVDGGGSDTRVGRSTSISFVAVIPVSSRAACPKTLTTGAVNVSVRESGEENGRCLRSGRGGCWTDRDDSGRTEARPWSAGLPGPNLSLMTSLLSMSDTGTVASTWYRFRTMRP